MAAAWLDILQESGVLAQAWLGCGAGIRQLKVALSEYRNLADAVTGGTISRQINGASLPLDAVIKRCGAPAAGVAAHCTDT